jgi:hypothetical protein
LWIPAEGAGSAASPGEAGCQVVGTLVAIDSVITYGVHRINNRDLKLKRSLAMESGNRLAHMSSIKEIQAYLSNDLAVTDFAPMTVKEEETPSAAGIPFKVKLILD